MILFWQINIHPNPPLPSINRHPISAIAWPALLSPPEPKKQKTRHPIHATQPSISVTQFCYDIHDNMYSYSDKEIHRRKTRYKSVFLCSLHHTRHFQLQFLSKFYRRIDAWFYINLSNFIMNSLIPFCCFKKGKCFCLRRFSFFFQQMTQFDQPYNKTVFDRTW